MVFGGQELDKKSDMTQFQYTHGQGDASLLVRRVGEEEKIENMNVYKYLLLAIDGKIGCVLWTDLPTASPSQISVE